MARRRLLDWSSGGALLALAAVAVVLAGAWQLSSVLDGYRARSSSADALPPFLLEPLLVDSSLLVAVPGLGRDGIPSLDAPQITDTRGVAEIDAAHRGKYLVSADRVLGIEIDGLTRAYPLRVLAWHEVVNDTLAEVPLAITYSPLSDTAVVFRRTIAGGTVEFGTSGFVFDSNLVLYDRSLDPLRASLWSQVQARAIAGAAAAAGRTLEILPASLVRWAEWTARHPETTVLDPDRHLLKRYSRDPYGSYLAKGELRFPVRPLPPPDTLPSMAPVLVLRDAARTHVVLLDGSEIRLPAEFADRVQIVPGDAPLSVFVEPAAGLETIYTRWFAWYATRTPGQRAE